MQFIKHCIWIFFIAYLVDSDFYLHAQTAKKPVKDLTIGNKWIFSLTRTEKVSLNSIGLKFEPLQTSSYSEQVVKDSVIAGKKYSKVFSSQGGFRWERADEKSIYWWNGAKEVIAFSFPSDADVHDTTYTEFSTYLNTNLTVSTQHRKGFGFFSQLQSYKVESWRTLSQPHFNIGPQLVYKADVQYLTILKGAKLQDSIWGDTSFALIRLLLPDTTITVTTNSTFKIPIAVESSREIQEVFSTSPTFQLYYEQTIEPINLPTTATLDVSSRRIILPYDTLRKVVGIEFRILSSLIRSEAGISLTADVTEQGKIPFQIVPGYGTVKFQGPTFPPLKITIDSVNSYLDENPVLPITISGIRPLVNHGLKTLNIALNLPFDIADVMNYRSSSSYGSKITAIQIPLPTDSDTCIAQILLRTTFIQKDTAIRISAIAAHPIPNIASILVNSNTAQLNLSTQTLYLQPKIKNTKGQTDSLTTLIIEISPRKPLSQYKQITVSATLKVPSDVAVPEDPDIRKYELKNGFYLIPIYFGSGILDFNLTRWIRLRVIAPRDTSVILQLEDVKPTTNFGARWQTLPITEGNLTVRNPVVFIALKTPELSARVGESISIPLTIETSQPLKQFGIDSIGLNLSLNASTLEPLGLNRGTVKFGIRTIQLFIPQIPAITTNQVNLPFRAAVGNTTTTYIIPELQLPSIRGRTLQVSIDPGIINIVTNNAGGSPLQFFSSRSAITAVHIAPNPANEEIRLTYFLETNTTTEIQMYDALGNKIATILQPTHQPFGEHTLRFNTSRLAIGQYYIIITTPFGLNQQQFTIIR